MTKRILIIDDEPLVLDALTVILQDFGYEISTSSAPDQGIALAHEESFDLILCDLRMPGKNGAEATREIIGKKPDSKILVITAYPNDALASQALANGAIGLLKKPFEISKILKYLDGKRG